jgi:glutathione synthase/RimK-type ligase-like ATP-grasp enzyme
VFLSTGRDLHAAAVAQALLKQDESVRVSIVDMDQRSEKGGFSWSIDSLEEAPRSVLVKDNGGAWIALDDADLVWCRRFTRTQRRGDGRGFLTDQWNAAGWSLAHLAHTTWIDPPRHIIDAENKALQLRCAHDVGFRVPRTLISQDVDGIRAFARSEPDGVIVKPLRAAIEKQIYTIDLTPDLLDRPEACAAFPAIYQQKIGGDCHLRIVCLPESTVVFMITSRDLDWRRTRDVDICRIDTDTVLADRCQALLRSLDITMGVIDAKVLGDEIFFLEVNPQGQFLFLEALTGVDLRNAYADYFRRALSSAPASPYPPGDGEATCAEQHE